MHTVIPVAWNRPRSCRPDREQPPALITLVRGTAQLVMLVWNDVAKKSHPSDHWSAAIKEERYSSRHWQPVARTVLECLANGEVTNGILLTFELDGHAGTDGRVQPEMASLVRSRRFRPLHRNHLHSISL